MPSIGGSQGGLPSGSINGGNVGPGFQGTIGNWGLGSSTAGQLGVADTGMGLMGNPGSRGVDAPTANNSFYGGWEDVSRADPIMASNMANNAAKGMSSPSSFDTMLGLTVPLMGLLNYGMGMVTGQTLGDSIVGGPSPASGPGPGGMGGPPDGAGIRPPIHLAPPQPPGPVPFQINPMQVQNDMMGGWGGQRTQGNWGGGYQQPRMNPFSMYGSGQPANRGYNPFSMYGGK